MNDWLPPDPLGQWERTQLRQNAVRFEHPKTDDTLIVLRLQGLNLSDDEYDRSYVLRHIPDETGEWTDLATVKNPASIAIATRDAMRRLPEE